MMLLLVNLHSYVDDFLDVLSAGIMFKEYVFILFLISYKNEIITVVYFICSVGAAMPVLFSYYIEFIPKDKRGPMIGFLASFWMVGNILTATIAWIIIPQVELGGMVDSMFFFGSWRIFVVIGSFPSLSSALLFFCLPESPKFLQKVCVRLVQCFVRSSQ